MPVSYWLMGLPRNFSDNLIPSQSATTVRPAVLFFCSCLPVPCSFHLVITEAIAEVDPEHTAFLGAGDPQVLAAIIILTRKPECFEYISQCQS
jgi:hypothetical protein